MRKISYAARGLVTKPTYTHKLQGVSQHCLSIIVILQDTL